MKKALTIVGLGLLVGLIASPALAGITYTTLGTGTSNVVIPVATETIDTTASGLFKLPVPTGAGHVYRKLDFVPNSLPGDFYVLQVDLLTPDVTFSGTLTNVSLTSAPAAGNPGCAMTVLNGAPYVAFSRQYQWKITYTGCTAPPTLSMKFSNGGNFVDLAYSQAAATALAGGTNTAIQTDLLNSSFQSIAIDGGATKADWITAKLATGIIAKDQFATTATLDVATQKKNFLPINGDTLTIDNGAALVFPDFATIGYYIYGASAVRGSTFSPADAASLGHYQIELVPIAGASFANATVTLQMPSGAKVGVASGNNRTIVLTPADSAAGAAARPLFTTLNGTASQNTGSYQLTISYIAGNSAVFAAPANSQIRLAGFTYTVWDLNATTLYAPFANGNTLFYTSRFYICAPQSTIVAPTYDVVVWTIPSVGTVGSGTPVVTLAAQGGPNAWDPMGCLNIKLEDILTKAGLPVPYQVNAGNVAVEFTVPATKVIGIANVFSSDAPNGSKSLATYPLFELK